MTVVMELDWTTQVTKMPTTTARKRLFVTAAIMRRKLLPATACIPSDMFFMPSKKIPNPPISPKINLVSASSSTVVLCCLEFLGRVGEVNYRLPKHRGLT